jgi:hypothetical protein
MSDQNRFEAPFKEEGKAGDLPREEGTGRAFILKTLGSIIEAADLERRIAAIEQQQRQLLPGAVERLPGTQAND